MLNNEDFVEDYEAEMIVLEDDLGNEQEFEFLDVVEFEGEEYVILLPADEDADEVMILRVESVDDENESYVGIDDVDLLQTIFSIFKERYKDAFDFENE